jgi:hypothetical protein
MVINVDTIDWSTDRVHLHSGAKMSFSDNSSMITWPSNANTLVIIVDVNY